MSEINPPPSSSANPPAANSEVFSPEANSAAMRIVDIADARLKARKELEHAGRDAQNMLALIKQLFAKITDIKPSKSDIERASRLVELRSSANDEIYNETGSTIIPKKD